MFNLLVTFLKSCNEPVFKLMAPRLSGDEQQEDEECDSPGDETAGDEPTLVVFVFLQLEGGEMGGATGSI